MDCCCFNRPFDDLSHDKVRFECEAVLAILKSCESGKGNYTNEREAMHQDVTIDDIAASIRRRKEQSASA